MPVTCTKDFSKSATYLSYQPSIISVNEYVHHTVSHVIVCEVTCTKGISKSTNYSLHQVSVISLKKMSLCNSV